MIQLLVCQCQLEKIKSSVTNLAVTVIADGFRAAADKEIAFSVKLHLGAQPFQALQLMDELPLSSSIENAIQYPAIIEQRQSRTIIIAVSTGINRFFPFVNLQDTEPCFKHYSAYPCTYVYVR